MCPPDLLKLLQMLKLLGVEHFSVDAARLVAHVLKSSCSGQVMAATPAPPYALAELGPEQVPFALDKYTISWGFSHSRFFSQALYWRILAQHTASQAAPGVRPESLDVLLGDTVSLCALLDALAATCAAGSTLSVVVGVPQRTGVLDLNWRLSACFNSMVVTSGAVSDLESVPVRVLASSAVCMVYEELLQLAAHVDPQDEGGVRRLVAWLRMWTWRRDSS